MIEVEKIMAAMQHAQSRLATYNAQALTVLQREAELAAAREEAEPAKAAALRAIAELQITLAAVNERDDPVAEVENSHPLTGTT